MGEVRKELNLFGRCELGLVRVEIRIKGWIRIKATSAHMAQTEKERNDLTTVRGCIGGGAQW